MARSSYYQIRGRKFSGPVSSRSALVLFFTCFALIVLVAPTLPHLAAANGVTTLCAQLPHGDEAGGAYPASGGVYVESYTRGDLDFCSGGVSKTLVAHKLSPDPSQWQGMGAVIDTNGCLDLAMTSQSPPAFSIFECVAPTGAALEVSNPLPSSFCKAEQTGLCFPAGTAIDKNLNLYYVDPVNGQLVECTRLSMWNTCSALPASSALTPYEPTGLYLKGTTFYVAGWGGTCSGKVWKGTSSSLHVIATLGDQLDSVSLSTRNPLKTAHVYVGASGACTGSAAVIDVTDGTFLPSAPAGPANIYGLDSRLQFATLASGVYQTTDTS